MEWRDWSGLEWRDLQDPLNARFQTFTRTLNLLYRRIPALWSQDETAAGLRVTLGAGPDELSYLRYGQDGHFAVVALNLQPVEKQRFAAPVPAAGRYRIVLNTESQAFGGTWTKWARHVHATATPAGGLPYSVQVVLPAMGALILVPASMYE